MINVERLSKVIHKAGHDWLIDKEEHNNMHYGWSDIPEEVFAQAAINDVLDQLIEQLAETDSITETMCRNYMVDWLKAVRGQK